MVKLNEKEIKARFFEVAPTETPGISPTIACEHEFNSEGPARKSEANRSAVSRQGWTSAPQLR
jgi:hypothetical protein